MLKGKNSLYKLVKSLEKEEKRYFRIYVGRTKKGQDARFIQLFDLLDQASEYNEAQLRKKMGLSDKPGQYANLKRHLYQELLTSLRLQLVPKHVDLQIREQLDFARILYSKGHYMESLKLLERIKEVAKSNNQDILHLEVLEFQKHIEARHITRSRQIAKKMDRLLEESTMRSMVTHRASVMANLNIQIHGYYIEHGFAISEADHQDLQVAWQHMQPTYLLTRFQDTFFEKVNRIQALLWYRYIQADLRGAQGHAAEWVNLFRIHPKMRAYDPDLYMRSLYYLMVFYFLTDDIAGFEQSFAELDHFIEHESPTFNRNSELVAFVYRELSVLNRCFLQQDYPKGLHESRRIKSLLKAYGDRVDSHRVMLFEYKFAAIRFALGRYQAARAYLGKLLHYRKQILRHDIDINARLLELMCLYETREFDFMGSRLTSLARSMGKDKTATPLQKYTLTLLRELHRQQFQSPKEVLTPHATAYHREGIHPADQFFLKYLNVAAWIHKHLE
ncbi:MAG: hypothetical protein D6772_00595 [Bacteroidetes bacterium]|nr:MAG: hypothetical protein D6772_00595 [Bacteroidota bacterium]